VDGEPHGPQAYVFGNACGERVGSIKRAWEMTVLRANGQPPAYVKGKPGQLTAECRDVLRRVNLHFHDLRRQFACTIHESGSGLHDVQAFLGHANVTTTSRYLASSPERLARALAGIDPEPESDAIRTPSAHAPEALDASVENLTVC
ncbi:MAG: site-specific integrase, partial [Acidobacteriota bacterium]|nr:site-specific integrase [Acidobacteriota bacterium]